MLGNWRAGCDDAPVFTKASLAKTNAAIRAAGLKIEAATPAAENAGAKVVAGNMASRAPVRTGQLRSSIGTEGSSAVAGAPYAIPVDRGVPGHNQQAQPFAEDAAKASEAGVAAAMTAIFRTALGGR